MTGAALRKPSHPLLAQCPSLCVAVIGARYPAQSGQGRGAVPSLLCTGGFCPGGGLKAKNVDSQLNPSTS